MYFLQILSPLLLAIDFVWIVLLLRKQKNTGLVFIAVTVGFIGFYEFLELLEVSGLRDSLGQRFWMRGLPVAALTFVLIAFLSRSLTQHSRLENQLRLGNLTHKTLFNAVSDTIAIVDGQTLEITDINNAGCEKYGYTREELLGRPITQLSAEPEKTADAIAKALDKIPIRYHRKKDGTEFPVEVTSGVFSENNRQYFVSIIRDISARVLANQKRLDREEQMRRYDQALGQLSRSNVVETDGLQAAFEQITEVAAEALDLERVSIWLYDQEKTKIICQDLYESRANEHSQGGELLAKDFPTYFAALNDDRIIAADDAHQDSRTKEFTDNYLTPLGIVSMLDAPIRILGKNVGVICHEKVAVPRHWSQEEEVFAASIADFAALFIKAEERQAIRRSMDRLIEAVQLTPDFVGITKIDGHSPFLNEGGRIMLGIGKSESIGELQVRDFLPDSAWKKYREEILPLVMIDGVWSGENSLRRRDGHELTVSQVIIGHRNSAGKIEYLSTIMRDMSAQKLAEQALRRSEERYRALYEDNPSMYFTVDAAGVVLSVNRYGAEHLGYMVKELVGKSVLSVFYEDDKATVVERLQACLQTPDQMVEWEFRKLHKDGSLMWVKEYVRVVRDSDGKPVVLIVCDDITERKKAEEEIHKLNSDLKDSSEQMRRLAAHLQNAREQERKRIALEIHDELGQQLTNFMFQLKRCFDEFGQDDSEILEKTDSLKGLVREMIKTVRRIATELRPGVLDEFGLVAAIEWQSHEFIRNTGIKTVLKKESNDIQIDEDKATAVFRIFQEALTNIARHSEATEVQITLGCKDGLLVLEVQDNGKGVTEKELRNSRSLGVLGMRERAEIFGGSLTINGIEGRGTSAVLQMPLI